MSVRRAWVVGVVGYSILRAVIAWGLFRDYGVNPWVFAVIDVGTAIPYATAIAALPTAIVHGHRAAIARHSLVATGTFFAPYAYVGLMAEGAPTNLVGGLVLLAVCLCGAAGVGLWRKTRNAQSHLADPHPAGYDLDTGASAVS